MQWTIQDLGAVGEFVSAIAVVITVGYLAYQIRQSTRATKAATYQDVYRDLRANLTSIPRTAVRKRLAGEALDDLDENELQVWRVMMLRGYENWYRHYRIGTIDRDVFEAYISHAHRTYRKGSESRVWLDHIASDESHLTFTEGFLDFLLPYVDAAAPGPLWRDVRERWLDAQGVDQESWRV